MFKGKVVAFALILAFATSVHAGDVDDCLSTVGITGCTQMSLTNCPAGDFEFIRDACGTGITAYIWIVARDAGGLPIPGIPWTDYWLNACDAAKQLVLCSSPIAADSLTGVNGQTTFSNRVAAGGCSMNLGIWWAIQGKTIKEGTPPSCTRVCLNVIIKSPDITGSGNKPDGIVNLVDLVPFGNSYNKSLGNPAFNPCCDFNDDNVCNLTDFGYFGIHYQHRC